MSTGPRHRRKPDWLTSASSRPYEYDSAPSDGDVVTITSSASSSSLTDLDMSFSFRDRTNEFFSAVDSLRGRSGSGIVGRSRPSAFPSSPSGPSSSGAMSALQQRSKFTQAARQIGGDLAKTCTKLEKLALLAKNQSLFDDRGGEIQQLTYIIKQDLAALNKQIGQLQEFARSQSNTRQRASHSNAVVVSLQSKLASASNEFKNVLEVRTESLKKQAARREHFTTANGSVGATAGSASSPGGVNANDRASSILLQDDLVAKQRYAASTSVGGAMSNGQDVAIDIGEEMGASGSGAVTRYQQQMLLIDEQDKYYQQRADTMKNIEQTIVELGDIFHQLAYMVKEQEEMVARIDSNVDDAALNVDMAHSELLKYFKSISSNRWLMIKVFGVLIVFFIIFVVFVA